MWIFTDNSWKWKFLSHIWLFETPWTVAHQAPLSMEFSRQEYWNGFPFPSPEDLHNPGIKPGSPALQADSVPSEPPGKPLIWHIIANNNLDGKCDSTPSPVASTQFSLVHFSCSIVSDSLQPHELQHARPPCHHQLLEFTQTHVHWVSDAIQPFHLLSSPSPAFNLSQHQGLFKWVSSLH